MINVVKPGLQTTVQDAGRPGYYNIGMPPSGAMDQYSYTAANLLVGNAEGAAALEATYMGPELAFTVDAVVAVTGAEMPVKLNGKPAPNWEAFQVKAGDVLSFDFLKSGARAYIAVAGGFDVPLVLGSRSTYVLCGMGGYQGRGLKAGDTLAVGPAPEGAARMVGAQAPEALIPNYGKETEIRLITGLCDYRLTDESKQLFLDTVWSVTQESDRIGYRFRGVKLEFIPRKQPLGAGSSLSNVVDLGYPIGSIQVNDIEPICLLNDAVTGGGYATIGTVISVDRDLLAQCKTHDKVRFKSVTLEESLQARKDRRTKLDQLKAAVSR